MKRRQLVGRIICAAVLLLALALGAKAQEPVASAKATTSGSEASTTSSGAVASATESDIVASITTTDGQTFKNVKVRKVLGDTVLLFHSEGAARVPLSALSDDTRKALGLWTRAEEAAPKPKELVKYGNDWVMPEEKQRLEADARRKEQALKEQEKQAADALQAAAARPDLELLDWRFAYNGDLRVIRGRVRNNTKKEFSYVRVDFNLYDATGDQIGNIGDSVMKLEPNSIWEFECLFGPVDKAATAKLKALIGR